MHASSIFLLACSALALPSRNPESCHRHNVISKLSGYLIEKIYGPAPIDSTIYSKAGTGSALSQARYKDEVVLRFNISNEEEIRALGSATNTLFLDVWESNREWADIRIAKDVVGQRSNPESPC